MIMKEEIFFNYATGQDIPFIANTYAENIEFLHGNTRDYDMWKKLLLDNTGTYYIVRTSEPVAWFRVDEEKDTLWLGMLQVNVKFKRRGIGKKILSYIEELAKSKGINKIGIHTTEDNMAARALYEKAGYEISEIGKCTTADGVERIGYTFIKIV